MDTQDEAPESLLNDTGAPTEETVKPTEETAKPEPITDEEYQRLASDATLDRAKLLLVRIRMQAEIQNLDFAIAKADAVLAELNRRRVYTMTETTTGKAEK